MHIVWLWAYEYFYIHDKNYSHLLEVNLYNFNPQYVHVETSSITQLKARFKKIKSLTTKKLFVPDEGFLFFHWSKLTIITMAATETIMTTIVPNPTLKCRIFFFFCRNEIKLISKKNQTIYGQY